MTLDEEIKIFWGNLKELNRRNRKEKYKISDDYYQGPAVVVNYIEEFDKLLEKTREDLKGKGYDGLIHTQVTPLRKYILFITGVPIERVK